MSSHLYEPLGPRGRQNAAIATSVLALLALAVTWWVLRRLSEADMLTQESWSILGDGDLISLLWSGFRSTLLASAVTTLISLLLGVAIAILQLLAPGWIRPLLRVWLEVFRGLPVLVLILFVFLGAPALGLNVSAFWALVVGLSLMGSAVISEIVRSGMLSVADGQKEAAYSLGFSRFWTIWTVLLPQALRSTLPALISQLVTLIKGSSLGFIVGYEELFRNGRNAVEFLGSSYALPVFTVVALIYIATCMTLSGVAVLIERRRSHGPLERTPATETLIGVS